MKYKRVVLVFVLLLVILVLICLGLVIFSSYQRIEFYDSAQAKLESVAQGLPIPSQSSLVLSIAGQEDEGTAGCFYYSKLQVYGNNDLTLHEIINIFSNNLQANGWKEFGAGDNWRSFWLGDKEFVSSVSDDANLKFEWLFYKGGTFNTNIEKIENAIVQLCFCKLVWCIGGPAEP